ncbi:hypothetical protein GCM10010052_07280 [Paenarthrobacter histidinolovorans]|nr:hypothetical protein GCM10010052_07280 [Paenarthrobacter histidinolovorans]
MHHIGCRFNRLPVESVLRFCPFRIGASPNEARTDDPDHRAKCVRYDIAEAGHACCCKKQLSEFYADRCQ